MLQTQVTIAMMKDGTIAVETSLSVALIQWPFLTDVSLVWAAASIFDPGYTEGSEDDPSLAAASNAAASVLAGPGLAPWLYFNIILQDSQLFVPVADPVSGARATSMTDESAVTFSSCSSLDLLLQITYPGSLKS